MADIPNTKYITINANGIFVAGKSATHYRRKEIYDDKVIDYFKTIMAYTNCVELHVLSSETSGEYAVVGNPSGKHGSNAWCRAKFNNGKTGSWVFNNTENSAANCARFCAFDCVDTVLTNADFSSVVLEQKMKTSIVLLPFCANKNRQNIQSVQQAQGPQNTLMTALQNIDLSKLAGKPVQLNGYEIVVKKSPKQRGA